jgi:hypothetical protein
VRGHVHAGGVYVDVDVISRCRWGRWMDMDDMGDEGLID